MEEKAPITNRVIYDLMLEFKQDVGRRFDQVERRQAEDHELIMQHSQQFAKVNEQFVKVNEQFVRVNEQIMRVHDIISEIKEALIELKERVFKLESAFIEFAQRREKVKVTYSRYLIGGNAIMAFSSAILATLLIQIFL